MSDELCALNENSTWDFVDKPMDGVFIGSCTLHQLNVKNTFLHSDLEEVVFMKPPPGCVLPRPNVVCRLQKYPYGLKQAPRACTRIMLTQQKYVSDLVATVGLTDNKLVGSLVYLTMTRPDISYAVQVLSQFVSNPYHIHHTTLLRVIRYVRGSMNQGVLFRSDSPINLKGYTNVDWVGCPDSRHSVTGWCMFLGTSLVSWKCKKQSRTSKSATESEYRAMSAASSEIIWLRRLLSELGVAIISPTVLHADNTSAIKITINPVQHENTKHIEVDCHYIRELVADRLITLQHIFSHDQLVDLFTKAMTRARLAILAPNCYCVITDINLRGMLGNKGFSTLKSVSLLFLLILVDYCITVLRYSSVVITANIISVAGFIPKDLDKLTTTAYTGVNYSLNHLVRLLSTPGLTSSKESQIPILKLELGFLRTFLWWTEKCCRENGNLEALLLQIEVVARNAVSHIQSILLKGVEDIGKELDRWFPEVVHRMQRLKPEIEKAYIEVAKFSPPMPDTLVVEFMNSLIDNLKDLLRYQDPSTFSELRAFVTKQRFLRNLLSFVAARCIDQEKLKDLTNHTEGIAIEAACIPFMCAFDPKDGNSTISIKDKLTELMRKIKPITPDIRRIFMGVLKALSPLTTENNISDPDLVSIIDTLQDWLVDLQEKPQSLMDSSESDDPKVDPIQVLLEKIRDWGSTSDAHPFKHYAKRLTFKVQFTHIQDLAVKVGCTIFFFFDFNELEEHKLVEAETTLDDLIKKVKPLKLEIGVPIPLTLPERRALGIAAKLEFLSSFLKNCGENFHEHEKLRNLAIQLMTAAYRAEYDIETLLQRDVTVFNHSLSLIDAVREMKRIRREVMVFDQKMSYVTDSKVVNLTMPSRDVIYAATQEELVGFMDEKHKLIDQLTRGSHQLCVIVIVGMPGIGKTTIANRVYNDPTVSNHFDICAFLTRFLIVMDDVWNAKAWKVLSASLPKDDITGSRILLTTRSEGVAYGVADLQPLGEEESWILLQKKISQQESCPPKLKELGMQISKKTKGIPFAIILVAGILFNAEKTVERWTEVLESLEQTKIGGNDQYLTSIIGMSYQDLPDCLRHCFLYFGALPQDDEILTSKLIGLWITKGFVKNSNFLEIMETILALLDAMSRDFGRANAGLEKIDSDVVTMRDLIRMILKANLKRERKPRVKIKMLDPRLVVIISQWPIERDEAVNLWVNSSQDGEDDTRIITEMSWLDVDGFVVSLDKVVVEFLTFITTFTLAKTEIQHQKEPWPCNFLEIMETILALLDALSQDLARANAGLEKINSDVVTVSSSCFADCFEWFLLKWPIERDEAVNLWVNSSQDGEDDTRIITEMVCVGPENWIKNLCSEISLLNPDEAISEERMRRIIIRGLKPEFIYFVTSIQGWAQQPSLEEFKNLLSSQELLAKLLAGEFVIKKEANAFAANKKNVK
ncbi:hypothetical protein FXO38_32774 [Capsicum annuum]|nr:hypothetical protein FXO38_32774 [Capsicum annuum]